MKRTAAIAAILSTGALLTACAGGGAPTDTPTDSPTHNKPTHNGPTHDGPAEVTEVSALHPRLTYTHEGGLTTLDVITGDTLATTSREGFLRLNPSGDGRTLLVSAGDEYLLYDTAAQRVDHGDHSHFYSGDPVLTSTAFDAPHAGHVVAHGTHTALFSDGEGTVTLLPTDSFTKDSPAEPTHISTGAAHHGVAVPLGENLLTTTGTEESRSIVRLIDASGTTQAETTDCPGVHGEAVAAGERVVFGCENGPVIFDGAQFHKVPAQHEYQRSGNLAGHPDSPYVLADHKIDADAEHEHPTAVAIIDTRDFSLRTVDLEASYWFRSLGRDEEGNGVVLATDGTLKIIDMERGEVLRSIPVIEPWEEKEDWQEAGPILKVADSTAYVSDAAGGIFVVDLASGEVVAQHEVENAPVEMEVTGA
ncbi:MULTISPECIES: hypothetical protein [unclassified Corynebacterium]|uniref:hypothetical protein n=1 Tax=unclassified Corynebacterium TaxID=2624378 RepID=UPI0029C9C832|nr:MULTISPECIES: hypothetical protein [unclassified Corynebacterium]WPF66804.1 hypothetical protein OLX12_03515 [Corynebacterium sp. 22KM0430]WPF69292.1 hypothetical protein OLW90_03510 [Corynebacterium sp. 21KM1197]